MDTVLPDPDSASGACALPDRGDGFFFGLPHWWKYLPENSGREDGTGACVPHISKLTDLWYIALSLIDILLTAAGILAFIYIVYAGVLFVLSQGEPDKAKGARQRIINASIGLVIVMIAASIVRFVGATLGGNG